MKISASSNSSVNVTASVRSNFATQHLRAATRAARNTFEIEQANATADHGSWFDDMMLWVPVSVVMAAAALEANANELIQDILDGIVSFPLAKGSKLALNNLKNENSGNTCEKYRNLALLFGRKPEMGTAAWQDANLLVKFRNALMHFKPAWDHDEAIHNGGLVKGLKTRIPVYRAYKSGFLFPYGFMTYGCAKWSVATVLAFSDSFSMLMGVNDRFASPHLDYTLH